MRTDMVRHGQFWGVLVGLVLSGGLSAASVFAEQTKEPPADPKSPPMTLEDLLQAAEGKPAITHRQPVPDQAAVQKALKMLDEVYKDDMTAAKTPEKKRSFAGRLLAEGLDAQIPAEQFALLQAARQWAVQAGDVSFALRAADAMIERFQVDAVAIKAEALEGLSKTGSPVSPVELAEAAEPLVQEALDHDAYDMAVRLSRLGLNAARRTKNAELIKRLTAQNKEVEQAAKAYQKIQAAKDALRQNPNDPEANLLMGRYLCFEKGRWEEGLPHLAQSADESLRKLGADDLAKPTEAAKQTALAEAWWQRAQEEKDTQARSAMQGRCAHWYGEALPKLGGLDKIKAQRRIQEAGATAPKTAAQSAPRHYLDPQNRKNIAVSGLNVGIMPVEKANFLRIEKSEGGYRVQSHPDMRWCGLVFYKAPPAKFRMILTFTIERGRVDINICSPNLETHPPRIVLPSEGKHTIEVWMENMQKKALLDGRPVYFEAEDPRHNVNYL
ncbi:MAG TPA: hypothetical protein PLQ00_01140, partial [Thermoguttaceae bacterium]|nr:hypothetical protein [Thermoguttaceae bacterium]